MIRFHDLLRNVHLPAGSASDRDITGVCDDSRRVQPGDLFVARAGGTADGSQFLADAQARGAVAAVVVRPDGGAAPRTPNLPTVVSADPSIASLLAQAFHGHPTLTVKVLGVTGTNGKTTTTYLLRHLLQKQRQRCGLIGTVETDDGRTTVESTMTTPGAIDLAALMGRMRDNGCRSCAMEVSSHSLDQGRAAGVHFTGAVFTNLTGDHLDYHKTMDAYAAAKAKLFESLPSHGVAVVNGDDTWAPRMVRDCPGRIIRFGFTKNADYRARDVSVTSAGTKFVLHTPDGRAEAELRLIGKHNVENALAAAALAGEVFGLSVHQLVAGLRDAAGAPGRLQSVHAGQPFAVLVDYAHTDDALENVLKALRPLTRGTLRVLFGCGGDRDATKRPRMARVAEKLADAVYVTSDNPRTESAAGILDQICAGFNTSVGRRAVVELDRRSAIERVLGDAGPDDVVLIAGKGHENYQIVGTIKHHFDDVEECRRVLEGRTAAA